MYNESMTFLRDRGVKLLDWPALTPDLNPIENLWGIVARQVYDGGRQFETCSLLSMQTLYKTHG